MQDVLIERKMVKRKVVDLLSKVLDRQNVELLTLVRHTLPCTLALHGSRPARRR